MAIRCYQHVRSKGKLSEECANSQQHKIRIWCTYSGRHIDNSWRSRSPLQLTLSGNLSSVGRIDSLESGFAFTLATMDHRLGDPSAVGSMLQRDSYFQLVIGIASDATIYCHATWRPTACTIPPRPKIVSLGILGAHRNLPQSGVPHGVVDWCQLLPGLPKGWEHTL